MLKGMPEKCEVMLGVKCFVYHIQNTGGWEEEGGDRNVVYSLQTHIIMYVCCSVYMTKE